MRPREQAGSRDGDPDEGYNLNGDTSAPCGICIWCEQEKDGTTATGGQLLAAGWRFTTRATASGTHD